MVATARAGDRAALAAVAGQFFLNGFLTASLVARAPQIRDRIGVDLDRYGLLLSLAATTGLASSLLAGRIVHAASTRRVLQVGGLALVAALPIVGAARSPVAWVAGMVVFVVVDALVDVSMNLQGSWLSARRHHPVMHRLHGVWSLGMLTGGLGAVGANGADVSVPVHLGVVAVVAASISVAIGRNVLRSDEDGHADAEPTAVAAGRGARLLPTALIVAAGMFAVVSEITGGDWAAFRLTDDFGASAATGSAAFVAFTVGMTATRFGGDWLQDRIGRRGLHRLSVATSLVGFGLATLVPVGGVAIGGFLLVGSGVATFMPKLYDDAARLPGRRGAGLGAMTAGMRAAFLVTPVGVGALAGTSLSVGAAVAIFTLPATLLLLATTEATDRLVPRSTPQP